MENKLNFYTKLISTILDSCCTYVIIIENLDIKLISFYGNKPFDLDTLKLIVTNFDSTKKSFSVIDVNEFKNTIKNEDFNSKNLNSIGYSPILDENKITIGYLITSFNTSFSFIKSQKETVTLISKKIAEKLRKNKKDEEFHIANNELLHQTDQKAKCADELIIANKELAFQNAEKEKREAELLIANKELAFQTDQKAKRADELIIANKELAFQNAEKEKRANELIIANEELVFQNQEKEKRAAELLIANEQLVFQNQEKEKRSEELLTINLELDFLHKEQQVLFASIVNSSDDAMLSKTLDGIITSWNYGAEKIFGYSAVEIIGKNVLTLIPLHLQQEEVDIIEKIKNGETVSNLKTQRVRKDGSSFYASLTISPIRNFDGNIIGASKVLRDITEQKKNELLLQDSNEKYKYLFDNNPSPLFIFDFETLKILDCNIESLMLYGYTKEEFLQLTIKDIRPEEDKELILKTKENESTYGEIHKKVWRHLKKNGELMYVEITGHLLEYNNRKSSLVLINDITATIELEKKQIEHVQFIEAILENLPIGIAVNKINDGSTTLMNQKFYEIYGWPKQDLTDVDTFFEKVYPDVVYREKIVNQVIRDMSSKDPERMYWEGITITTQDGTKKIINAKKIPIYDQNLMISTVVDVTEMFTIQKKLLKSNERYHYATKATSDAIWDWDYLKNIIYRAEGFKTIFGFDLEELNLPDTNWENYIHPDDKHSATKSIHDKINGSENYWKHDYRIIKPNGQVAYVHNSAYLIRDENNKVTRIIGALKDITESNYYHNVEILEKEILEINAFGSAPINEVIAKYMLGIEKLHSGMLCSMQVCKGKQLFNLASPSLPEDYLEAISGITIGDNVGSCGTAAFTRKKVIVTDISNDFRWANYKEVAAEHGLKACWSHPIINSEGEVLATFATYYREVKSPTTVEENTIMRASHILQVILEGYLKEKALKESNLRYHYATQATSDAIWDWDFENNLVYRAEGFKNIFGFDMDELNLPSTNWENYIHPDDKHSAAKSIHDKINGSENYWKHDYRIIKPNGQVAFVQDSGYIIRGENNTVIRIIGALKDVTQRKKEEQQLKLFASVVTNTKDSVLITEAEPFDEPGPKILYVNDAFTKMTGYTAEEVIGKTPRILQGPKSDRAELKRLGEAIRNWESYETTIINYKKNGEEFWINFTLSPVADEKGWFTHWIAIERDVTQRKKEEQQLKLFKSVITNTSDAILISEAEPFDEPGPKILYVNDAFTEMTGYTKEEIIGKTPRILQGPKSDRAELNRLGEAIRNWESYETTIINYKKNGEEFWVNIAVAPVANERGWFTHWTSIQRNVTTRKNEELQNELIAEIRTVFSEPLKLNETLDNTLRYIADFGDFCFAEAWLTSSDQNILNKISSHATTENMSLFLEETNSVNTSVYGEDFSGIVSKSKEIIIWGDLANQKLFLRRDAALKYGLKTIIGLPLFNNNEVIGVLAFGLDHEVIDTAKYQTLFKKLGDYLSPEIKRKQLEIELNKMFNFAPDLIAIIGLDGCFKRVNPAACKLLDYTQEELCAEPYANFIHPEDREKSISEIATLIETNLTYYFENRYITKSGKIKWLAWNAIYVTEDNNIYAVAKDITDKKELEDLLNKANELARIGGWEVDLQNNTVFWSDITREIHEVALDYIPKVETGIAFYKKGSNRTKITEYLDQAINTGKSWDDEFQIVTAKGNEIWIRVIGEAEFVNRNCIRIYGSFQDINERKKAESELIENENYLRTILENEPECVKVLNIKGELLSMNPAGLAMIDADNEQQVLGHRMTDLVNKKYKLGFNRLSAAVFKGNSGTFEFEITGLKGRHRWLETHAVPLKDTTGKVINLLGVTRDITERKKAEEEIKNTEERRKLIMNAALDAIICIDKDGMITFWNPKAEQVFGWSENEAMGKLLSAVIIPERYRSMHDNGMKNYLKTGRGKALNVLLQLSAIRRNGTEFPIELTVLPIRQDGEEFFCAFIRDITERKTHEDQLLKLNKDLNKQKAELITSNKELEQFAYVASHDLQEPLRMVTSFLTLIEKRYNYALDEKGLKYINFAVEGAKNMRQIILDILEFSRINNNEDNYEFIDLKEIIKDISLLQSKLIKEKKAKIIFEELPKVYSIRHYLLQLFQNIISNALKYSKEEVPLQIIIKSEEHNNYYQITINDNGIGIEEEYYEKIFIIFQRLHGKEKYQGNGMGLAIAKKIVDKLNGKIWVKSKAGIGSTFYINIPKK